MRDEKYNSTRDSRKAGGFSLIELLIVVAIILIIAAIAVPNLLRAKMAANESAAVSALRAITSASITYSSTYVNGYPPDLPTLGGAGPAANCNQAVLLDPVITTAPFHKSGYAFAYTGQGAPIPTPPPGCGAPGFNGFLTTAAPIVPGQTGNSSFCSAEPGVIHFDTTGAVPAGPAACQALNTLQ